MNHTDRARSIYERWQGYLKDAREGLPTDAPLDQVLYRAIAGWREHEPPELAFVPEELSAERIETRHETTEDTLIERVERGELIALKRGDDILYLSPEGYAQLDDTERAQCLAYDPLLARAIRRHALAEIPPSEETP